MTEKEIPFIAIGNGELDGQPLVVKGDVLIRTNDDDGTIEEVIIEYGTSTKTE